MCREFEKGELVSHIGVPGKKFKVINKIVTHYEIQNLETNEILIEPIDCLLDIIEARDILIKFLLE